LCAKKHSIRGRQAMVLQGSVGLQYAGLAPLPDLGSSTSAHEIPETGLG